MASYIVTLKWGDRYRPEYVNRLASAVRRHTKAPVSIGCFTGTSRLQLVAKPGLAHGKARNRRSNDRRGPTVRQSMPGGRGIKCRFDPGDNSTDDKALISAKFHDGPEFEELNGAEGSEVRVLGPFVQEAPDALLPSRLVMDSCRDGDGEIDLTRVFASEDYQPALQTRTNLVFQRKS